MFKVITRVFAKKVLKSHGLVICEMCDSVAESHIRLCEPCQYFFDEEERRIYERDMLELAQ